MILVTGGAGYIGSVTAELLISRGERVAILDNLDRGHRHAIPDGTVFYEGNIGDRQLTTRIAQENEIEACIHFAALAYVGESVTEPARYYQNNVEQGIALIDSLLAAGVRQMVFSSTCATYGEPQQVPISEDHPQNPTSPYGWSKLMMERIMESFDRAYGLRFIALRYFNAAGATGVRGEAHFPETHLVPNVVAAALGQIPELSVFGDDYDTPDGTAIRDYVHVADLAMAHILALDYLRSGGRSDCFNLGSGHGYSVREVIETAEQVTGSKVPFTIAPRRAGDPSRLVADAAKAETVLGWKPEHQTLASIIRTDWEWRARAARPNSTTSAPQ
jgi:UDP-glucose 4-epimerase